MRALLHRIWTEPRPPGGRGPGKWDFGFVAALLGLVLFETSVRPEVAWGSADMVVGLGTMLPLLWRKSRPLAMVLVSFGAFSVVDVVQLATGVHMPEGMYSNGFVLMLPYSLWRWGAGREVVVGTGLMAVAATLGGLSDGAPPDEMVGGYAVLFAAMAVGAAARFRARARLQEIEQVKSIEREQLARDLHDTVAHHVSAIAIRAQAGLAIAPSNPEAAVEALRVIEGEAKKSLTEMRAMVTSLRQDASLAPQPGISDLSRLTEAEEGPPVRLDIRGDVDDLSAPVSAAIFRLAQESITNARRHARGATRIDVGVEADAAEVRLQVVDDGAPAPRPRARGYGLVGMRERAELLGGTCEAGPARDKGWAVKAVLPREAVTS